jgi:hypothetical protein
MPQRQDPREREECWFRVSQLLPVFAVSQQAFRQSILVRIAKTDRKTGRGGERIYGPAAIEAWSRREWARRCDEAAENDPYLADAGAPSPALEEYRRARAGLARLELAERQRALCNRVVVHETFTRMAAVLRRTGDMLQRRFGAEALDIFSNGLQEAHEFANTLIVTEIKDIA